jgi:membrane protease YdiL (CAAX protease family)
LGNIGVHVVLIPGFGATGETSIYSLISSPSNPLALQVVLLFFDAVGYEFFFRGALQKNLTDRFGLAAAPAVAMFDALLHVATLNFLWVGTTFVADLCWGLTYRYGHGLQANVSSHFLWDLAIFVLRPIT